MDPVILNKPNQNPDPTRLDAGETAFFKRQLEYVKSETYDVKYKNLMAKMLFPVSTEAPSGSQTIIYRSFTKVGVAKIIADYANDFPRVDIYGEERIARVRGVGDSYGYSIVEIRRAQRAGVNLNQRRADAAKEAIEQFVDNIGWNGDSDYNLQGFIGYPGVTEYTVPSDGTGLSKLWSTKTPDQIVRDITGLISAIITTTNDKERPDTLMVATAPYLILANTRMTDGDSKTILTFIKENNPFIKEIVMVNELTGAGAGSTNRMYAYTRSPKHITFEIPQQFEQFTEQQKGMEFVIPCHEETGGIIIYYPLSVAFGDGI